VTTLAKLVAALGAPVLVACNGASSGGSSNPPCSHETLCTPQGSNYVCDCGEGTWPACPANANQAQSCDEPNHTTCMSCSEGATIGCECTDAGSTLFGADASGSHWLCVGGGQACQ
jgi:hypothetical protein